MRRALFVAALCIFLMPTVQSQVTLYGVQGLGSVVQKGEAPMFAGYTAINVSLYRDTAAGIAFINRDGVFYSDADSTQDELKGGFAQLAVRYGIPLGKASLWLETGAKVQIVNDTEADKLGAGFGLSGGLKVYKNLGFAVTGDWLPVDGPDKFLFSIGIDLFPNL